MVRGAPATHHLPPFTLSFSSLLSLSLSLFLSSCSFYSASAERQTEGTWHVSVYVFRFVPSLVRIVPLERRTMRTPQSSRLFTLLDAAILYRVLFSASRESLAKTRAAPDSESSLTETQLGAEGGTSAFHAPLADSVVVAFVALVVVKGTWVADVAPRVRTYPGSQKDNLEDGCGFEGRAGGWFPICAASSSLFTDHGAQTKSPVHSALLCTCILFRLFAC